MVQTPFCSETLLMVSLMACFYSFCEILTLPKTNLRMRRDSTDSAGSFSGRMRPVSLMGKRGERRHQSFSAEFFQQCVLLICDSFIAIVTFQLLFYSVSQYCVYFTVSFALFVYIIGVFARNFASSVYYYFVIVLLRQLLLQHYVYFTVSLALFVVYYY